MPVQMFFPAAHNRRGIAAAVAICERCAVRERCAVQGADEQWGVWGGVYRCVPLPPMRKEPGEINHGTDGGYGVHRARGEDACAACREAHRLSNRARYDRAKRRRLASNTSYGVWR